MIPDGSSKRHRWLMFRKIDPTVRRLASCDDDDVEREHEDANDDDDDEREREKKGPFPPSIPFQHGGAHLLVGLVGRWLLVEAIYCTIYSIYYI